MKASPVWSLIALLCVLFAGFTAAAEFSGVSLIADGAASTFTLSWTGFNGTSDTSLENAMYLSAATDVTPIFAAASNETVTITEGVFGSVSFASDIFTISFTVDEGAVFPADASFTFAVETATAYNCGANATYVVAANEASAVTIVELEAGSLETVYSNADCSSPAVFAGVSLTVNGDGAPKADSSFVVSWDSFANHGAPLSGDAIIIAPVDASIFTGATTASEFASVSFSSGVIVIAITGTVPASGSIEVVPTLAAGCGVKADYSIASITENVVVETTVSSAEFAAASCPASMDDVVLTIDSGASATISVSWNNYTNDDAVPAASFVLTSADVAIISSVSTDPVEVASDVFAAATISSGVITIAFTIGGSGVFPASGDITFPVTISSSAACDSSAVYTLSSSSTDLLVVAGSLTATAYAANCPGVAIFGGVSLSTTSSSDAFAADTGLTVSWLNFDNSDSASLNNALVITPTSAQIFGSVSSVVVSDDSSATAVIVNGAIYISFSGSVPVTGAVTVTLGSGSAACGSTGEYTVSAGTTSIVVTEASEDSSIITASSIACPATFTGFSLSFTTQTAGAGSSLATVSWTGFTNVASRPLDSTVFTVSSNQGIFSGPASSTAEISALGVASGSFATVSFAGTAFSVNFGAVTTLPSAGTFSFPVVQAQSAACDSSATYNAVAFNNEKATIAGASTSATAVAADCVYTYAWVCSASGETCSATVPAQFGTCDNDCGAGQKFNDPKCGRFSSTGSFEALVDADDCADSGAKPVLSLDCEDYTCPDALWLCYPVGANVTAAVPCSNDDDHAGFPACSTASGCAFGDSVARSTVCVSDSSSTESLGENCPLAPVATEFQCPNLLDECAASIDPTSKCFVDEEPVECLSQGTAERHGECVNAAEVVVQSELCVLANVSLSAPCTDLRPCSANPIWISTVGPCTSEGVFCKSFSPVEIACGYELDGEKIEAAEYTCASIIAERPLPYVACAAPEIASCNKGLCNNFEDVTFGDVTYTDILATCSCPAAISGPSCNLTASVSTVAATANAGIWTISWASVNGDGVVADIVFKRNNAPVFSTIARGVDLAANSYMLNSQEAELLAPAGSYQITIVVSPTVSATSSPFTVEPACAAAGFCQNGSTCNTKTGSCSCVGGWSGVACSVSPCDFNKCVAANTQVNNTCSVVNNQAQCNCKTDGAGASLFKDNLCAQPKECTQTCRNGGTATGSIVDGVTTCTGCSCPSEFTGASCETCAVTCSTPGTQSSSGCGQCACKKGFSGPTCACRYVSVNLVFPQAAVSWYFDEAQREEFQAAFSEALVGDLNAVMKSSSLKVVVASFRSVTSATDRKVYLQVSLQVGPDCSAAASVSFSSFLAQSFKTLATVDMTATYAALNNLSTALTNNANLGATLGTADPSNVGIEDAACGDDCSAVPKGTGTGVVPEYVPPSDDGGSSGLSRDEKIAVGVVVGVGGFLIIVAIVLAWKFGCCCFNKTPESKSEGVEMGTYDV